jgi:hypothetical protein
VLAPGVGAQGGTLADLPGLFGAVLPDVLPAVSREVLRHGPDPAGLRAAADRLREDAAAATAAGVAAGAAVAGVARAARAAGVVTQGSIDDGT